MAHEPYLESQITIVPDDGYVYVDGVALTVDMTELPEWIHAIQWNGKTQRGHIEFKPDGKGQRHPNMPITDASAYHYLIDRWDIKRDEMQRGAAMAEVRTKTAEDAQRAQRKAEHEHWQKHKSELDPKLAAAIEAACVAHGGYLPT
jgi:hypothetical protein